MRKKSTKSHQKQTVPVPRQNKLPLIISCGILIILISGVIIMNLKNPITYSLYATDTIQYEKGTVTAIISEELVPSPDLPDVYLGEQVLRIRLRNGVAKGSEIEISNFLSNTHNIHVKKGQRIILKADRPKNTDPYITVYNYDRSTGIVAVSIIFAVFMLLIGRFKGLRSLLGLCISLFFIIAFLVPAIYHGYSPVLVTILTGVIIASCCLLLLNGFSRKTLAALAATAAGLLLSGLFYLIIAQLMSLHGFNLDEAEELILVSRTTGLQVSDIIFSGVILASLGAVIDMTISVSAALYELLEKQPELSLQTLFLSGMSVGSDMIGSMCQTLILAFVGTSIATLLTVISFGTRFDQLMSSDYIAIEVVHSITGSLSVITAVPITVAFVVLAQKLLGKQKLRR